MKAQLDAFSFYSLKKATFNKSKTEKYMKSFHLRYELHWKMREFRQYISNVLNIDSFQCVFIYILFSD